MSTTPQNYASTPTWMIVLGWFLTLLVAAGMIALSIPKFLQIKPPEGSPDIGWPQSVFTILALVEIACAVLYLFPRTATLGAILLTGYLGGAVAAHVRILDLEHFYFPIIAGVLVWLGLFFRDARVRALMPIRGSGDELEFVGVFRTIAFAFLGILVVLIGIAAVVFGIAATQPAEFHVERSISIDAPASEIFPHANDFHKWDAWSPWLKPDPDAKVTYEGPEAGKDSVFRWKGNDQVGEGSMKILESQPSEQIKIKIDFYAPRQGTGDVGFTFKEENKKTVVTWSMAGHNADLLEKAVFLVLVNPMIGEKYNQGLAQLKKVVEEKK